MYTRESQTSKSEWQRVSWFPFSEMQSKSGAPLLKNEFEEVGIELRSPRTSRCAPYSHTRDTETE